MTTALSSMLLKATRGGQRTKARITIVALLTATGGGGTGTHLPQTDWIVASSFPRDSGAVMFDMPGFPWRSHLPARLRPPAGTAWDTAFRDSLTARQDEGASAEVPFPVSLPDGVRALHYVLLDASGPVPLRIDSLVGVVRLAVADTAIPPEQLQIYGSFFASPTTGRRTIGGGFVLASTVPLDVTRMPSARTADDLFGAGGVDYPFRETPFWAMTTQYELRVRGDSLPYVFVQWAPDEDLREAGCRYRFTLFRLGPVPVVIGSTNYGCDV